MFDNINIVTYYIFPFFMFVLSYLIIGAIIYYIRGVHGEMWANVVVYDLHSNTNRIVEICSDRNWTS